MDNVFSPRSCMKYKSEYESSLGKILIESDENYLTGLWFEGQKYYPSYKNKTVLNGENKIIKATKKWLDIYFTGTNPHFKLPIRFIGTEFQKDVWNILCEIPYGMTITYKEIADMLARKYGINKMSAQAVGTAVGRNKISIVVPCHRVIGKNGDLTGYAGGIDKKRQLLIIERNMQK